MPTKDGHTSVKLTPKHIKTQKPIERQFTKTNTSLSIATIGLGILFVATLVIAFLDKKREIKEG